ncbi:MAG: protoheme IX farnesyltransferase [Deltaproteobacteria bacterium]|nr:MAG: protoheme IX farnesyltransferase [Deltaproteobacteria bacterium]
MSARTVAALQLAPLASLIRLPLALMVAVTALAGALAAGARPAGLTLWGLFWGVFLLAAAASILNQVRERTTDALMRRTAGRPLACGRLAPAGGTAIGLLAAGGGLAVLTAATGPATTLLGLAALAWYLAVYTPLKRATSLAVLAGTPCGAVPPLMGWLAAGGALPAPQPLALALVMLLWQVPHYWLLAIPDRAELRAAGFRVLPELGDRQLVAVSRRWIVALALATALLPLLAIPAHPPAQGAVAGLALALAGGNAWLARRERFAVTAARRLRHLLHLHLALVLLAILAGTVAARSF